MSLKIKARLCDRLALRAVLDELAGNIGGHHAAAGPALAFVGIISGGAPIADYLADRFAERYGFRPPVAYLDITLYRDDMITTHDEPYSRVTEIPFAMRNKEIVLIDDVLFTGRTIRASLTSLLSRGRPRLIRLAVAVDRGGRELPIQADYVGRRIEISDHEGIRVIVDGPEEERGIYIVEEAPE
ncbi:MAG: bifunctional pyr operon transcriptional regulator/uracil phosphoribosyltransferase PyrR [Acidobacteriota bacterium]|nr:bifunctional pyr operon transcriptional regulator/uracil phosphoribosyltransferase PyrR [Acidobacteriota bacterium]